MLRTSVAEGARGERFGANKAASRRLIKACKAGNVLQARALLEGGADANFFRRKGSRKTALYHAATRGHGELVRMLLSAGADPTMRDSKGVTIVQAVAKQGHAEIGQLLRRRQLPSLPAVPED